MQRTEGQKKNYKYTDYIFEKTTVRYINIDERVYMILIPNGTEDKINDDYSTKDTEYEGFPGFIGRSIAYLVQLHLSHHRTGLTGTSLEYGESTAKLKFSSQKVTEDGNSQTIETYLTAEEGYAVRHILTHYNNENGFEVKCVFENNSDRDFMLEMISSVSLDGLSPFMHDDGSKDLRYHLFKGGWAIEGKHVSYTLPEMSMEQGWGWSGECETIGSVGSRNVGRYFPYAALEDEKTGCTWGVKLKHNATWQINLARCASQLSLTAGIGDYKFGAWRKKVAPGESYETPVAYAAVAMGGIDEVSNDLLEMNNRDIDAYGEEGMPIIFNDWVTNWGDQSEEKLLALAECMKNTKVKYFVADAGWYKDKAVGTWEVDETKFPNGMKAYADKIRQMGMVPGIWMEFESVREASERFDEKYDDLYLKKDGNVIVNGPAAKFLDFRKPEVIEYLDEKVIKFLKDSGIGYLKVDYNANVGIGCDGADSLGEGLNEHMTGVYEFFKKIKREIPDIIIENCASGGWRLEPKMMGVTAMSSFSDAHECIEVPVVAANLHYLISPRQSQVWCTLHDKFSDNHIRYIIAAGFLGRLCWSGHIEKLSDEKFNMIPEAESFYESVSHIIKHGRSRIYRTQPINYRALKGTQAVIRYSEDRSEILAVCHFFDEPDELVINLDGDYEIQSSLYNEQCTVENGTLKIKGSAIDSAVLRLKKK